MTYDVRVGRKTEDGPEGNGNMGATTNNNVRQGWDWVSTGGAASDPALRRAIDSAVDALPDALSEREAWRRLRLATRAWGANALDGVSLISPCNDECVELVGSDVGEGWCETCGRCPRCCPCAPLHPNEDTGEGGAR